MTTNPFVVETEPKTDEEPSIRWQMRPGRLAIGLAVLACGVTLLRTLETDTFEGRPLWFGYLWIATMILSLLVAPILIGNGLGLFSSELLASSGTGRARF